MAYITTTPPNRSPLVYQVISVISGGMALFLFAVALVGGIIRLLFSGQILPGISVAGVDLSNRTPDQAVTALNQHLTYPDSGQIVFRYGDEVWVAHPKDLGLVFDVGATVEKAYSVGRKGLFLSLAGQLNSLQGGLELAPIIVFDERVAHGYLQNLAVQIDRPVVEARLTLLGTEVQYIPGQTGRLLDVDATLKLLANKMKTFADGEVSLVIDEKPPVILSASKQAEILRKAVSTPLTLLIADSNPGDPGPWILEPALVAGMISIDRVQVEQGWEFQVSVDTVSAVRVLNRI